MVIREATSADIPLIKELAEKIWPEAYHGIISDAQIQYMLHLIYSEEALHAQMSTGARFIFAQHEGIPVGFASFSKKSDTEPQTFRLHKLYVLPRQHAQGIGSFLLDHLILESKKAGATLLELNVNKFNPAKKFYNRKDFTILREEVLDIGGGYVMDDYVMIKTL